MAINAVSAGEGSAIGGAIQQATGNQELGQQAFLKLLITQLTNQDPLQPQDQSQFLAQLAQFSTVEGVNNVVSSQSRLQASSLLGKTVDAQRIVDNTPRLLSGQVTAVRWDESGVHLTLGDGTDDVKLSEVMQVRDR